MGEIHRLPNPEDTEREAGDWFARMNADDVTADDRARFEAWLLGLAGALEARLVPLETGGSSQDV